MLAALLAGTPLLAQTTDPGSTVDDEEVLVLSPFEVTAQEDNTGYAAATTLAGNRLNTDIKDLGTSLSVYTQQFLKDIGATDNQSLLKYTLGTEIGGVNGNYSGSGGGTAPNADASYLNPQSTNRVRGLVSADNTRDLYLTGIPWDGYNIDAVDLQRGPNAILFGQGSPGGVINTRTKQAIFRDLNEVTVRVDQYGSLRGTVDFNREIIEDQLAVRVAAAVNRGEFKQEPAFENFDREWVAVRYEPGFLKEGSARTILKANFERGDSTSNRPRNMPPGDNITPWFTELNKELYNMAWQNSPYVELPGRGAAVATDSNGNPNPGFTQWVNTNYGNNYFGGSEFWFLPGSTSPVLGMAINEYTYLGLGPDGARDGGIGGIAPGGPHGIRSYRDWANATNQPFASLVKSRYITDPKIFNFYDRLLDGNIKREWSDFETYDVSLSQTFFNDKFGFDVGYHHETVTNGNYSPLVGGSGNIFVDYYSVWPDGTNDAAGGWYTDGTPNPGAGRPFVQLGNGASEGTTDRDSVRGTAFVTHDFDKGDSHWLLKLLGQHTLTGMASSDDYYSFGRSWARSAFDNDWFSQPFFQDIRNANGRFWADFIPIRTQYIGESLVGKNLGDDFGIVTPVGDPMLGDSVTLRYFDSTWTAVGVDPGAPWFNNASAGTAGGPFESTQSENPANYVGWVTREVGLIHADSPENIERLTTGWTQDTRSNDAYAFVWQGKFWNDSIIATAGTRHDEVYQRTVRWDPQNTPTRGDGDLTKVTTTEDELGPVEEDSDSWGAVVHFNRLPWIGGFADKLPVQISASYNKSNNFQTGQVFSDYFGQQLPLPAGETEDIGVILATKDGKYSFKLNKFESTVANNPSSFIQFWNYGNNVGIYAQAWSQFKYNYETRSNPSSQRYGSGIVSDLPYPEPGEDAGPVKYAVDFEPRAGETPEQAAALETAVIQAWDAWLAEMAPLPEIMANAWGFSWETNDLTESALGSFRLTSELVAEGYEAELHAQVTDSWRLTLNASKIKSTLDNIGQTPVPGDSGMTQIDYLLDFDRRLNETVMGDLRIWGGGATSGTARENWRGHADGDLKARLAEQGTNVPENRIWHVNLITNYDFKEGILKNFSVGGSARYQSAAVLAYTPFQGQGFIGYDLDAPYKDEAQIDYDLWVGYGRRIWNDKIDWRVQLNIQNVGVGDELVPITVQPDGTPAAYRIRPPQNIFLTNTFRF